MGIDAFVLRYRFKEEFPFVASFLASADFDVQTLQRICQEFGLPYAGRKSELAQRIAEACERSQKAQSIVMQHLIGRDKGWFSVKSGEVSRNPICDDPRELLVAEGEERWYGPIDYPLDSGRSWYIRPVFVPHWEIPERSTEAQRYLARWLCFARVTDGVISLHWRGFSHADSADRALRYNTQFPYWEQIPALFEEIEDLTRARVGFVNLHHLILHVLWERYRYDGSYAWFDRRIRAESGGVALSAHAGAVVEIEVAGIRRLAHTLRRSVEHELETRYDLSLPDPENVDEVILRTLIREFGTLSYEFSLESESGGRLFRAHNYFGLKPEANSPDSFPHSRVFTTWGDDLGQLSFLLRHRGEGNASEYTQASLL
jgi:hypothetical protein